MLHTEMTCLTCIYSAIEYRHYQNRFVMVCCHDPQPRRTEQERFCGMGEWLKTQAEQEEAAKTMPQIFRTLSWGEWDDDDNFLAHKHLDAMKLSEPDHGTELPMQEVNANV